DYYCYSTDSSGNNWLF
nr:immunoglobulin light chain junction region [Macaca mulatta]MOX42710.1 immunoglobulin light chain junction region [Macaca mulatta]MOX42942.1 immunoglobulin light chain junction region [Macaca mulatta]MOX43193.1 immunoglobulin light chain junction region [Macaca mulatta]MOX43712.1 immunoglobulin light chain junction region [Macaca mulatta]